MPENPAARWLKLLCKERLGSDEPGDASDGRSPFQRDFDKIVFSSAFRRLQDKTQVFPFSESDYVRTRLTHSIEAASVGRSLGTLVGKKLVDKYQLRCTEEIRADDLGALVAAACLAHDIGNPPFGHSGEAAIRHWFKTSPLAGEILNDLDDAHKQDFTQFEGNTQGFRLLTRLQHYRDQGGMHLTYAVLSTFTKYPRASLCHNPFPKDSASYKKHGFFLAEQPYFEEVARATGLYERLRSVAWQRHPFAFLVEAADDICYHINDLEDGYRLKYISFERTNELLLELCDEDKEPSVREIARQEPTDEEKRKEQIEKLRAITINTLVKSVAETFWSNETEILDGDYDRDLVRDIPQKQRAGLEEILEVEQREIYKARPVLEIEAAGFEVLGGMLDLFVTAVTDKARNKKPSARSEKLLDLLPDQFLGKDRKADEDPYTRLLRITDYICGMTDSYAVSTYRKLRGISLPHS